MSKSSAQKRIEDMSEDEKAEQYKQYLAALSKDLGIDDMRGDLKKLVDFLKPQKEGEKERDTLSDKDKQSLLEADDVVDFLDKLGSIAQKYGVIEGQSDPYMKFMMMFANQHMEMMGWQLRENFKDFERMRASKNPAHP